MQPVVNIKRVAGFCVIVCAVASLSLFFEVIVTKPQPIIRPKQRNIREEGIVRWIDSWTILDELDEYRPPSSTEVRKVMKSRVEFDVEWPVKFEKNFRSPCWKEKGRLHCLPNAYILGVAKCATGSIWAYLHSHPQVEGHGGRKLRNGEIRQEHGKESHWWSVRSYQGERMSNTYSAEYGNSLFMKVKRKDWKNTLFIDGSPDTLWDPGRKYMYDRMFRKKVAKEVTETPAPNIVTASFIKEYTPGSKFIITLRNPVERLYSHHRMWEREKQHPLPPSLVHQDFHRKAVLAVGILKDCFRRRTIRECAYEPGILRETAGAIDSHTRYMTIQAGLYVVFISDWLKIIPRDRFYITTKEGYDTNPSKVYREMINFLELDEVEIKTSNEQTLNPEAPGGNPSITPPPRKTHGDDPGPMWNKTAELLDEFYRPFNEALAKLLGDQTYLWL